MSLSLIAVAGSITDKRVINARITLKTFQSDYFLKV